MVWAAKERVRRFPNTVSLCTPSLHGVAVDWLSRKKLPHIEAIQSTVYVSAKISVSRCGLGFTHHVCLRLLDWHGRFDNARHFSIGLEGRRDDSRRRRNPGRGALWRLKR